MIKQMHSRRDTLSAASHDVDRGKVENAAEG